MNQRGRTKRRSLSGVNVRLCTIVSSIVLVALVFLPKVAGAEDSPYSTISPKADVGRDIQSIYKLVFWMALIVFIGVQAGIVYTSLRYRRRADDDTRPEQIHGNKTLEIAWTIIPAVILLIIFIPTVQKMYSFEAKADDGETTPDGYVVEVYGKQWWWEIHYTHPDAIANTITANEVYVPTGKNVSFRLMTNNVIHSFWVPQLTGKMDLMPGHVNKLGFTTPDKPGVYFGECAEFCGDSHAFMRFKVVVVDQPAFDTYLHGLQNPPGSQAAAITGDVAKTPPSFGICLACHRVNGTNAVVAPVGLEEDAGTEDAPGAAKTGGPNLSNFACRTTIGAGILDNNEANLRTWLHNPGGVKQGNYMATVIKEGTLDVPTQDPNDDPARTNLDVLVDYLKTLYPEGGCPQLTGANADIVQQLSPPAATQADLTAVDDWSNPRS